MSDETSNKAIAARLELARRALGYDTQHEFAESLGASPQRWNNYVRGRERLNLKIAVKLCGYGLTLDWLYRGVKGGLSRDFLAALDSIAVVEQRVRSLRRNL